MYGMHEEPLWELKSLTETQFKICCALSGHSVWSDVLVASDSYIVWEWSLFELSPQVILLWQKHVVKNEIIKIDCFLRALRTQ